MHRENLLLALQMRDLRFPLLMPRLGVAERRHAERAQQFRLLRLGARQFGAQGRKIGNARHDAQFAQTRQLDRLLIVQAQRAIAGQRCAIHDDRATAQAIVDARHRGFLAGAQHADARFERLQLLQLGHVDLKRRCAARGLQHCGLGCLSSGDRRFEARSLGAIQRDLVVQLLRHHSGIGEFKRAVRGVIDLLAACHCGARLAMLGLGGEHRRSRLREFLPVVG